VQGIVQEIDGSIEPDKVQAKICAGFSECPARALANDLRGL
jgi:hypothetical protein